MPTRFDADVKGSIPALVTPFCDGKVDWTAFEFITKRAVDAGCSAVVVGGSTGEGMLLEADERVHLIRRAHELIADRAFVVAGMGTASTHAACSLAREAESAGAQALLISTPHYVKATQAGIIRHYEEITAAVSLPLILYNVPSRTGFNISLDAISTLYRSGVIAGLKEAGVNASRSQELMSLTNADFVYLCGDDEAAFEMCRQGAKGCISVIANLYPDLCCEAHGLIAAGELAQAKSRFAAMAGIIKALALEPNPSAVKLALSLSGACRADVRLPLLPCGAAATQAIKQELASISAGVIG